MAFVVIFNFLNDGFFSIVVHLPNKFIIKIHCPLFKLHIIDPVKKTLFGYLEIFPIDMERIGLPFNRPSLTVLPVSFATPAAITSLLN
jgi:hypothetical protein